MEDEKIIDLFWRRSEDALGETEKKYRGYLYAISEGLLGDPEAAEENVNDAYLAAWETIPPNRPEKLSAYLGALARRGAIRRLRAASAQKRGGGETELCLEELSECAGGGSVEDTVAEKELVAALRSFLETLDVTERRVFLLRYWHSDSVAKIAEGSGFSESKVKTMLLRTRKKLAKFLEKEGLT